MKLPWFRRAPRKGPGYPGHNVDSSYLLERDPARPGGQPWTDWYLRQDTWSRQYRTIYEQAAERARQLDGFALPPAGYLEGPLYGFSPQQAGCPQGGGPGHSCGVSTLRQGPELISPPVCAECGEMYLYTGWELTNSVTANVPPVVTHRWEHRNCPGKSPEAESEHTAPPGMTDSDATASAGLANER